MENLCYDRGNKITLPIKLSKNDRKLFSKPCQLLARNLSKLKSKVVHSKSLVIMSFRLKGSRMVGLFTMRLINGC